MWFKVDDRLPGHAKARHVRRSHPTKRRDSAPFGLWVLAGAFCDDGFIPLEVLEDWDDDAEPLAERLVAAGFWEAAEQDGEPGYRFHDWGSHNPIDASVSGIYGNHQRWHLGGKRPTAKCPLCISEGLIEDPESGRLAPDSHPIIAPDSGRDIAPDSLPDPTRPDPTRPDPTLTTSELRPDVTAILDHLDDRIRANGAKVPARSKSNLDAARLLIDRDKHDPQEIREVIDWATSDQFWRSNILSMAKLRDKFDQLNLRRRTSSTSTRQQQTDDLFAQAARRMGVQPEPTTYTVIEGSVA